METPAHHDVTTVRRPQPQTQQQCAQNRHPVSVHARMGARARPAAQSGPSAQAAVGSCRRREGCGDAVVSHTHHVVMETHEFVRMFSSRSRLNTSRTDATTVLSTHSVRSLASSATVELQHVTQITRTAGGDNGIDHG
jgi:hypothetical protein